MFYYYMKIVFFPGSFKPPHKGHLRVVKSILKNEKPDKIYIIISNKSRLLEEPFQKKLNQFSKNELDKLLIKYNLHTKKEIQNAANNNLIPSITPNISYKFWKEYINNNKVKIIISSQPSPIIFSFILAKTMLKPNDELILVKSEKDELNSRFSIFDKLDIKRREILIPTFNELNSWQMRKAIFNKDWKGLEKFIPKKNHNLIKILKKII